MKVVVAIDGPAGAGKSSTARGVAARLGYRYLDTGALYRALALAVLRAGAGGKSPAKMVAAARSADVHPEWREGEMLVFLDGEEVSREIRAPEVTRLVSPLSAIQEVRDLLVQIQRGAAHGGGVVVEGRDIGSVVLPDAEVKIFLTADLAERARRRRLELAASGVDLPQEEVERQIAERDRRDSSRAVAPLVRAEDAVVVDTTSLGLEEQIEKIVHLVREVEG